VQISIVIPGHIVSCIEAMDVTQCVRQVICELVYAMLHEDKALAKPR
jgi:hypothetical protein